jgi:RNA polymerase sigma-70 factor (ECF subfamily)
LDVSRSTGSQESCPETAESDLRLAVAVLRKDRKATAEFVALHADAVYGYVRHRLIPRADLVDDVVQEVFLAAWDSLASFRGESSLRAWLLSIARHKVEDYYRRRLREPSPLENDEDPLDSKVPAVDPQVDGLIDRSRLENKIAEILANLPETYGLILLWRYWEKRSARDIAVTIGRTEKAVERLLARARAQFKKKWNNG